ncbi:hypothetical protein BHE74_00005444 [Ensete ventricosum]|nr:hypothetical protein BHE74_00005444 [Ensete ventricosum]
MTEFASVPFGVNQEWCSGGEIERREASASNRGGRGGAANGHIGVREKSVWEAEAAFIVEGARCRETQCGRLRDPTRLVCVVVGGGGGISSRHSTSHPKGSPLGLRDPKHATSRCTTKWRSASGGTRAGPRLPRSFNSGLHRRVLTFTRPNPLPGVVTTCAFSRISANTSHELRPGNFGLFGEQKKMTSACEIVDKSGKKSFSEGKKRRFCPRIAKPIRTYVPSSARYDVPSPRAEEKKSPAGDESRGDNVASFVLPTWGDVSSPRMGRRNRSRATATSPHSFSPRREMFLLTAQGEEIAHGRQVMRRERPGDGSCDARDRAMDRRTREEIQVLFFFLPPSTETAPLLLLPLLLSPSLG